VQTSSIVGSILNAASGTITGRTGISVSGSNLSGVVSNAGLITGIPNNGIAVANSNMTGVSNTGTISSLAKGISISGSNLTGSIANSGSIYGSAVGIAVASSSMGGAILNSGSISANMVDGVGILFVNSTSSGGISNTGSISAQTGISVAGSVITGQVVNERSGSISGGRTGIRVTNSIVYGGVSNTGYISASQHEIYVSGSTVSASVTNLITGTVSGSGTGAHVQNSTINGGISNSGLITSSDKSAVFVQDSSVIGSVINYLGGTLSGAQNGLNIDPSTITGDVINAGSIYGNPSAVIVSQSLVMGSVINSSTGTINGGTYGVSITGSTIGGGVDNNGLMFGSIAGVQVNTSSVAGALNNTATIRGGITGIAVANTGTIAGGITNSGVIAGSQYAISTTGSLGSSGINIAGTTSTLSGDVYARNTSVNIAPNASFTNSNAFNVNALNISNTGAFNFTNPGVSSSNTMNTGITAVNGVNNAGVLNVSTNTGSITGNYTQANNGAYNVAVTNTTAGSTGLLNVSGVSSLAGTLNASVTGRTYYGTGTKITVVNAGTLNGNFSTINGVGSLNGNSFTTVAGTNLLETISGNQVILVTGGNGQSTYLAATQAQNNSAASGSAAMLDTISNSPSNWQVNGSSMQDVLNKLNADGITGGSAKVSNDISQTLPVIVGASSLQAAQMVGVFNKVVQDRQDVLRGLSSGDGFIATRDFWIKGVGSFAKQGNVNNVSGYSANTGGISFGIDKEMSPRSNLGAYAAIASDNINSNSSVAPSSIKANTYLVGAYGDYKLSNTMLWNYQADVGTTNNNENRTVGFMGWTANGNYNSLNAHVGTGIKNVMPIDDKTRFIPSARIDYTNINTNSYSESGAQALNLNVSSQTYNQLLTSVGLRLDRDIAEKLTLSANVGAGYNPLNNNVQITSAFQGGGSTFVTNGLNVSPWLYNAGVGITGQIAKDVSVNVRYDVQFSPTSYTNQVIGAKVIIGF
jgi:hypothetical protein